MERINVHLTENEIAELQSLADNIGISRAEIIRRAVDRFINLKIDKGITGILNMVGINGRAE